MTARADTVKCRIFNTKILDYLGLWPGAREEPTRAPPSTEGCSNNHRVVLQGAKSRAGPAHWPGRQ